MRAGLLPAQVTYSRQEEQARLAAEHILSALTRRDIEPSLLTAVNQCRYHNDNSALVTWMSHVLIAPAQLPSSKAGSDISAMSPAGVQANEPLSPRTAILASALSKGTNPETVALISKMLEATTNLNAIAVRTRELEIENANLRARLSVYEERDLMAKQPG
ncbi:hypothetical protein RCH09_001851 [Actimicrobium sp. GrIS 1.19]|uniref:hypothetical protein n=1 Tax=Actimicrobium sp. GrIS 1.19 TaxID=3071708 RepID=UPI002DFD812A|nr:hypothetical protein [Actimicrobium sp. GrIS 1.19]